MHATTGCRTRSRSSRVIRRAVRRHRQVATHLGVGPRAELSTYIAARQAADAAFSVAIRRRESDCCTCVYEAPGRAADGSRPSSCRDLFARPIARAARGRIRAPRALFVAYSNIVAVSSAGAIAPSRRSSSCRRRPDAISAHRRRSSGVSARAYRVALCGQCPICAADFGGGPWHPLACRSEVAERPDGGDIAVSLASRGRLPGAHGIPT